MNHSSPRMALKLLDSPPASSLHAFCARCGAPPVPRSPGQSAWRESRVCADCGWGLVLRTPLAVARDSPLLVVDRALHVSAVSRRAESLLGVEEQHAVGLPIGRLLLTAEQPEDFTELLHDAVLGGCPSRGVRCWIGGDHGAPLEGPEGPPEVRGTSPEVRGKTPEVRGRTLEVRGEPLEVRVGPCGPPPGALIVLDPPRG